MPLSEMLGLLWELCERSHPGTPLSALALLGRTRLVMVELILVRVPSQGYVDGSLSLAYLHLICTESVSVSRSSGALLGVHRVENRSFAT